MRPGDASPQGDCMIVQPRELPRASIMIKGPLQSLTAQEAADLLRLPGLRRFFPVRPPRRRGSIRPHGRGLESLHLRDERRSRRGARAATQALTTRRYLPIEQEHLGPSPDTILETLRRGVEESDAVLHIVGECHGRRPPIRALPRRSYTQWEYHYARAIQEAALPLRLRAGLPLHPASRGNRREAGPPAPHRAAVIAPGGHKYELIPDLATFNERIREIDLDRRQLGAELRRTRARIVLAAGALAFILILLFASNAWYDSRNARRQQQTADAAARQAVTAGEDFDPVRIKANLQKRIRERAAEETAKLDRVLDWEKIAALEKEPRPPARRRRPLVERMEQA